MTPFSNIAPKREIWVSNTGSNGNSGSENSPMKSIQARLIFAITAACALFLSITGIVLYQSMRSHLVRQFDDALKQQALRGLARNHHPADAGIEPQVTQLLPGSVATGARFGQNRLRLAP